MSVHRKSKALYTNIRLNIIHKSPKLSQNATFYQLNDK